MKRRRAWACTCDHRKGNGKELSYPSGDYLQCGKCSRPIKASRLPAIKRKTLVALLTLALPLLACSMGDVAGEVAAAEIGRNLCRRACQEADLEFYKYRHGDCPDCWCAKPDGEAVLLW